MYLNSNKRTVDDMHTAVERTLRDERLDMEAFDRLDDAVRAASLKIARMAKAVADETGLEHLAACHIVMNQGARLSSTCQLHVGDAVEARLRRDAERDVR